MIWYVFLISGIGLIVYNCAKLALIIFDETIDELAQSRDKNRKHRK